MVFTNKCNNYKELKRARLFFMCLGTFQVSVRILTEDLACYIGDIHKIGNDID